MDDLERRKTITFEQAEGAEDLPSQLRPGEITQEMRARLWKVVYDQLVANSWQKEYTTIWLLRANWQAILSGWQLDVLHRFVDEFSLKRDDWVTALKRMFQADSYARVLGFLQYVLRHPKCPNGFATQVQNALVASRSAYRVFDENTIAPIASSEEARAVSRAFQDLQETQLQGPRKHLQNAAAELTSGRWADSVRESIHAIEGVVRVLGKSSSVDEALKRLSNKGHINRNMSSGLGKLYHYTSDENGIRHPLLEDGDPKVDEADAVYMFGASAAFISYLLGKGRSAGLLDEG